MKKLICLLALGAVWSAGAVLPPPTHHFPGVKGWHDVAYGPRKDLPNEGAGFKGGQSVGGLPWKAFRHRSGQQMDVFVRDSGVAPDAPVVLYVHGGAWSDRFDKDGLDLPLLEPLVRRGALVCTIDYILQSQTVEAGARKDATFETMLRDIDLAAVRVKAFATDLGVTTPTLTVMGYSAGAHLSLLYAYNQDNPDVLKLNLAYPFRVGRAVSVVGPTDFAGWLTEKKVGRPVQILMRRLAGLPDDATDQELEPLARRWSPVSLVCEKSVPTVLAYGNLFWGLGTDGIVPLHQKKNLEKALNRAHVPYRAKVFTPANHISVMSKGSDWIVSEVMKK